MNVNEWQGKSDLDIAKAVLKKINGTRLMTSKFWGKRINELTLDDFDPCNNPSDAWPIILDSKISLIEPTSAGLECEWTASKFYPVMGKDDIDCDDENPLRAAMIVYLMMNEEMVKCQ